MSRLKKAEAGSQPRNSEGAIPAWLFFLLVAVLGAAAVYYKNNAGRISLLESFPSRAPLSSVPSTSGISRIPGNQNGAAASPIATVGQQAGSRNVSQGPFENLPGFPLTELNAAQKTKFLARVNSEYCNCGCKGDTIARCLVKDPACRIAPAMATRVLAEVGTSGQ
ncbi:MAG TPA: hypothetical protein VGL91_24895 [Acidobacteriota bacterium]|jgi:hypothetical protein